MKLYVSPILKAQSKVHPEFTALTQALDEANKVMDAYSEGNIMGKIMSMDGEGCGLDADLLDRKHGSEYATAKQGKKADSTIQDIKANGLVLPIDSGNAVDLTPKNLNVVPIGRTVNNKALSSDITLSYSDVGGASSEQGTKADSAVQGIRGNGTAILPDESRIVNITPENIGAATEAQGQKADYAIQGIQVNGVHVSTDINRQVNIVLEDFGGATAEQGAKADSAIHGVKINGTRVNPDSARIVDIDATSIGGATAEQGEKADSAIQGVKLNGTLIEPDSQNIVNIALGGATVKDFTAIIEIDWTIAETGEYTQDIAVTGILSSDNPIVDVVLDSSKDMALQQLEAWSCISKIETSDDSITVTCLEEAPTVAIPIQLKVVR